MIIHKIMDQTETEFIPFTLLEYSKQAVGSLSALTVSFYLFILKLRNC